MEYERNYVDKRIRVYLPEIITRIIMDYFKLNRNSFLEDDSEIPEKIFLHGKKHLLACLIGFIIDEGNIDSNQIIIALNNKKLIEQLSRICTILNYKYTVSSRKPAGYSLYILKAGVAKFWNDYLELKKAYPEVYMGYKDKAINNIFIRSEKDWKSKGVNQTTNLIINLLKEKPKTVNELAKLLMITRQGARYQIKLLEKSGIIEKKGTAKQNAYIYELVKNVQFPESNKGSSRPVGLTNSYIEGLLKKSPLTTMQLAEKLGMCRDSMINQLYYMGKKNKIKRVGDVKLITHPTILWEINHPEQEQTCK